VRRSARPRRAVTPASSVEHDPSGSMSLRHSPIASPPPYARKHGRSGQAEGGDHFALSGRRPPPATVMRAALRRCSPVGSVGLRELAARAWVFEDAGRAVVERVIIRIGQRRR